MVHVLCVVPRVGKCCGRLEVDWSKLGSDTSVEYDRHEESIEAYVDNNVRKKDMIVIIIIIKLNMTNDYQNES